MMACRSWQAAAYAMRGLTAGKQLLSTANLAQVCGSRLARHISSVGSTASTLTGAQLPEVVRAMPFLRELRFTPSQKGDWPSVLRDLQLPSTLRIVALKFPHGTRPISINAFISKFGRHAPLQVLRLNFTDSATASTASFAPLQEAHQLESLSMEQKDDAELTSEQLQQIRQLPVSRLMLKPCSTATLLALLQMEGPPLRWTQLPNDEPIVDDAIAALLPTLPHLTELDSECFSEEMPSSLAFLPQMPALRSLRLDSFEDSMETQEHIIAALVGLQQPLPLLTSLWLESLSLNSAQLQTLLTLTPRLQSLQLAFMDSFDSLIFLAPVKTTLQSLRLCYCRHPDLTALQLRYLQELSQLTELTLDQSLSDPLDDVSIASLTPPSSLMPALHTFVYEPPELDD